jgi:hypothetical protein
VVWGRECVGFRVLGFRQLDYVNVDVCRVRAVLGVEILTGGAWQRRVDVCWSGVHWGGWVAPWKGEWEGLGFKICYRIFEGQFELVRVRIRMFYNINLIKE